MKVILDCDPQDMGAALTLFFRVSSQNPTQKVGRENAIVDTSNNVRFEVTRNQGSYTVRNV